MSLYYLSTIHSITYNHAIVNDVREVFLINFTHINGSAILYYFSGFF